MDSSGLDFLGSTRVSPPNGISIGSLFFAQLTPVPNHTDTQTTLRVTSVAIGHTPAMHATFLLRLHGFCVYYQ